MTEFIYWEKNEYEYAIYQNKRVLEYQPDLIRDMLNYFIIANQCYNELIVHYKQIGLSIINLLNYSHSELSLGKNFLWLQIYKTEYSIILISVLCNKWDFNVVETPTYISFYTKDKIRRQSRFCFFFNFKYNFNLFEIVYFKYSRFNRYLCKQNVFDYVSGYFNGNFGHIQCYLLSDYKVFLDQQQISYEICYDNSSLRINLLQKRHLKGQKDGPWWLTGYREYQLTFIRSKQTENIFLMFRVDDNMNFEISKKEKFCLIGWITSVRSQWDIYCYLLFFLKYPFIRPDLNYKIRAFIRNLDLDQK